MNDAAVARYPKSRLPGPAVRFLELEIAALQHEQKWRIQRLGPRPSWFRRRARRWWDAAYRSIMEMELADAEATVRRAAHDNPTLTTAPEVERFLTEACK